MIAMAEGLNSSNFSCNSSWSEATINSESNFSDEELQAVDSASVKPYQYEPLKIIALVLQQTMTQGMMIPTTILNTIRSSETLIGKLCTYLTLHENKSPSINMCNS